MNRLPWQGWEKGFCSSYTLVAVQKLAQSPQAVQLRYMQTLTEISGEGNSTIVFPLPVDLISSFLKKD